VSVEDLPTVPPITAPEYEVIIHNPDVQTHPGGEATLTCQAKEEHRVDVESIVWTKLLGNLPAGEFRDILPLIECGSYLPRMSVGAIYPQVCVYTHIYILLHFSLYICIYTCVYTYI